MIITSGIYLYVSPKGKFTLHILVYFLKKQKFLNVKYPVIVQISWIISTGQPKSKVSKIHTLCLDKTPQILSFPLFFPPHNLFVEETELSVL